MSVRWIRHNAMEELSDAELLLLLDATNSCGFTFGEPDHINDTCNAACYLVGSAEDAIQRDNLDEKWGVNTDAFLAKLRNVTPLQAFELLVRLDCAWRNHERVENGGQWIATAFDRPAAPATDVLVCDRVH